MYFVSRVNIECLVCERQRLLGETCPESAIGTDAPWDITQCFPLTQPLKGAYPGGSPFRSVRERIPYDCEGTRIRYETMRPEEKKWDRYNGIR